MSIARLLLGRIGQVDQDAEIVSNVEQLISQMSLEEKFNELTQNAPPNDRLGIPMMRYSECLHGIWLDGFTSFTQAIALGSTWDPDLIREMTDHRARHCENDTEI